jgi:REP element-mobilizing transposase RayT
MPDPETKRRRSIRLPGLDYARSGPFFVTICSENRVCLFGDVVNGEMKLNSFGRIVEEEWLRAAQLRPETILDAHVVMPNHFHGIVSILNREAEAADRPGAPSGAPLQRQARSLGALIAQFKATTTRRINELRRRPGSTVWQRNYYEHAIRNARGLERIRNYIAANPALWEHDGYNPKNAICAEAGAPRRLR